MNHKKNIIWNTIGASANAFTSLFFAILVTRTNGDSIAGIFIYAFATACLLYVIGVYIGRTYQVTDVENKYSQSDYIYNRIFTCIIMIILAILFVIIKKYDFFKASVIVLLVIYKGIEAFSETLYAIIQRKNELYKVGISMTIKASLGVLLFGLLNIITSNLIIACSSLIAVNIAIVVLYDFRNIKKVDFKLQAYYHKNNISILKKGFWIFAITFLSIYIINAQRYAIDDLLESRLQTIYGIIIMPATVMGLLAQFIIQPSLNQITEYIKIKQYYKLKKFITKLIGMVIGIGIPVVIIAYFLGIPVLQFIYGLELQPYLYPFLIIIVGAIFYSISFMLSTILIALRINITQTIIYLIVSILSTIASYMLIEQQELLGASTIYLISMSILAIAFWFVLIKALKNNSIKNSINELGEKVD